MDRNDERRTKVFLEPLPYDFLRVSGTSEREQQEAADQQAALALQQQLSGQLPANTATNVPASQYYQNIAGFLSITVTQAKLVKNYGMTRMDPYVRLRIGHSTYETHTDPNGGKNPRWNKVIHSMLPQGLTNLYIEIYDECSFTLDELIAWTNITIPPAVLKGETREDWFPLSGKQGEGLEGMLHLVLSFSTTPPNSYTYQQMPPVMVHSTMYGAGPAMPVYVAPQMAAAGPPPQQISPEKLELIAAADLKQIGEMFPHLDTEVIKSVYDSSRGNKDTTINCLLQLNE